MSTLTATFIPRHSLTDALITAMYALYDAYYASTSPTLFADDLAEKSHVFLLLEGGEVRGFSTLALQDSPRADNGIADMRVIFSGDTIIHHAYWGNQALAQSFCHFAGQVKAQRPDVPLYWFLISKGYRTYRYLHLFSRAYWPHCQTPLLAPTQTQTQMPTHSHAHSALQPVLHALARKKFGAAYDATSGVIRFASSRGHLRPEWAGVRDHLKDRAEVEFFLARNPRYAQGEELACITLLEAGNLRSRARNAFVAGFEEARQAAPCTHAAEEAHAS